LTSPMWRKSSHGNQDGGACVEGSDVFAAVVPVRDGETKKGPALTFTAAGRTSFVTAVRSGEQGT
jgi:hypothetical protein